jgi:hypothetical protein
VESNKSMASSLGSAINEKEQKRNKKRDKPLAHALHYTFGLDRYPNYLHRWSLAEIEDYEQSLESQLEKVRAQKAAWLDRASVLDSILAEQASRKKAKVELVDSPLSTILSADVCRALSFRPGTKLSTATAREVVEGFRDGNSVVKVVPAALVSALQDNDQDGGDGDGDDDGSVFSLDVLRPDFCEKVLEETTAVWAALAEVAEEGMENGEDAGSSAMPDLGTGGGSGVDGERRGEEGLLSSPENHVGTPEDVHLAQQQQQQQQASSQRRASIFKEEARRLLRRPLNLDACGFGWLSDLLLHTVVAPLTAAAFPNELANPNRHHHHSLSSSSSSSSSSSKPGSALPSLDWRTAFIAGYSHEDTAEADAWPRGTTRASLVRRFVVLLHPCRRRRRRLCVFCCNPVGTT